MHHLLDYLRKRRIYKKALALTFKGDYTSHFLHIGRNIKVTLIAVDRILSSNETLPCFLNYSLNVQFLN